MDSVVTQTLKSWEHLVIDDGSEDGTVDEVERRASADRRIRYIKRTGDRAGANVCRNVGMKESRAPLLVFLDSDDLLRPTCLEGRVEVMHRNPILDLAVFRAGVFRKCVGDLARLYHPQSQGDDLLRFLTLECPWQTSGPVWRRSYLKKLGGFDETLLSMQDLELHVRMLCAGAKYLCLPETDHDIRWQDDATKTSVRHFEDPRYIVGAKQVQAKLTESVGKSGLLTWSRQRALLGLSFGIAESWVRAKNIGEAIGIWNHSCAQQQGPFQVRLAGCLLLYTLQGTGSGQFASRVVNKWKGWVRFRQEPSLLSGSRANSLRTSNELTGQTTDPQSTWTD